MWGVGRNCSAAAAGGSWAAMLLGLGSDGNLAEPRHNSGSAAPWSRNGLAGAGVEGLLGCEMNRDVPGAGEQTSDRCLHRFVGYS